MAISFLLMTAVLRLTASGSHARHTGLVAGLLVAFYIAVESPISGMSMNPARTLASAVPAHLWTAFWLYCTAPSIGMLLAAELHLRRNFRTACAKLHHENNKRCIFCGLTPQGRVERTTIHRERSTR